MSHRGYTQTKSIRERKRKDAAKRQEDYNKLTLEQKLAVAKGSKQRTKLQAAIKIGDQKRIKA